MLPTHQTSKGLKSLYLFLSQWLEIFLIGLMKTDQCLMPKELQPIPLPALISIQIFQKTKEMRTKMSPRRALLTAAIMTVTPTLLFVTCSEKFSAFGVLIASTLINWPVLRWLDDRQWYREWIKEESR